MAASVSLSTALFLYNPHTFSLSSSSSRPTNYFSLQSTTSQQFVVPGKLISRSYGKFGDSRTFFRPSVSAHQQNQPYQTNNEDGEFRVPQNAADRKLPSSLKSLLEAYKGSTLYGDRKAMYEFEDIMFMMEKEKNDLAEKVASLSVEISSSKEKYVRLQADFDNYRKRSEKEKLTVRNDAQGEVIESLLPMVDSFERAKQQLKLDTEKEKKIDTSYQGIYKQLVEIMRSLSVAAVPTVGKPFDPSMHEAIAREESQEFKEGIVIQEFRRGFYLGDRLLRPAMVKVSSGPGKKKPSSGSEHPASVAGVDNR